MRRFTISHTRSSAGPVSSYPKPTIYRNLYDNTGHAELADGDHFLLVFPYRQADNGVGCVGNCCHIVCVVGTITH